MNTTMIKLSGYVAKPKRRARKGTSIFLCEWPLYAASLFPYKAVMEAYEQLIPVGEQVSFSLF